MKNSEKRATNYYTRKSTRIFGHDAGIHNNEKIIV